MTNYLVSTAYRYSLRFCLAAFLLLAGLQAASPYAWAAAATTTTLRVTSSGSVVTTVPSGSIVTLTATVASGGDAVTPGQVNFCDTSSTRCEAPFLLATVQLNASGVGTYRFKPTAGSHNYQAVFVGTKNYVKSASTVAALTVSQPATYPTTTTLSASGTNAGYTLTATVTGLGAQSTQLGGQVSFLDTSNGNASLGTAALGSVVSGRSIANVSTSGVGANPLSATTGDFNGDGLPDLATINYGDSTMTVLLSKGDGTFSASTTSNVSSYPEAIVSGDFNGDGILDLATSNIGSQDLIILLGNGDGAFTEKSSPLAGNGPTYLAVGDFNEDGNLDLATVENDDGTVKILTGNGDGTFTTGYQLNVGHGEVATLAVGDFNGDGFLDLAISSGTILLGSGDGTFTAASQTVPSFSQAISGDFNRDGFADLAITNNVYGSPNGTVAIFLGTENGNLTTGTVLTVGAQAGPIVSGDFNQDGILDLAVANSGDNTVTLEPGVGDGTFSNASTVAVGHKPDAIVSADFTGNDLPGIATANSADNTVTTFFDELTEVSTAAIDNVTVSGADSHLIEASYGGSSFFGSSVSPAFALSSGPETTSLLLSSNTNPSIVGGPVTLTATLTPSLEIGATTDGEIVTFYNAGASIGTARLSSGVATLPYPLQLVGTAALTASYAGDANFTAANSNTVSQVVQTASPSTAYVVTTAGDTTNGVAANCAGSGSSNCSLRDAIAAAAATDSATITFDPSLFSTPQTITLSNATGLTIPPDKTINIIGPTTGNGATLKNLVTVSGGSPVIYVGASANVLLSGLVITGGTTEQVYGGGGILNFGILTVSHSTISDNSTLPSTYSSGAGIENYGSMTLMDSTVSGNKLDPQLTNGCSSCGMNGAGIDVAQGTVLITNSTISGNSISSEIGSNPGITYITGAGGGISLDGGSLTIINSTVIGNGANGDPPSDNNNKFAFTGGGISVSGGSLTALNSILSGNNTYGSEDDCDGTGCPANAVNGNVVGATALAAAGNYGGATQTSLPLPGSAAICGGIIADIPGGTTTDQRGLPRTTTYGSNPACVDSGSAQTNYGLSFSTQPPASVAPNSNFTAALQLGESGSPLPVTGVSIPITLAQGDPGALNVTSLTTNASGIAASNALQVSAAGTGDTLVASLALTATPPPSPLTTAASVDAISSPFDVTGSSQTISFPALPSTVMYGASPIALSATASSGLAVMFSATGPASVSGTTLTITGAGTVVVTASQAGNGSYSAAAPVSQTITVAKASVIEEVQSTMANANAGVAITFTATVTSSVAVVPTGSVQFSDGSTVLGSAQLNSQGVATYTTSSLAAGSHSITAAYSGSSDFNTATASLAQMIVAPSLTLSASPTTLTLKQGQSGQVKITLTSMGGDTGTFNISCTGLPAYTTCTPSPASLTADGSNTPVSSTLTIATNVAPSVTASLRTPQPRGDSSPLRLAMLPAAFLGVLIFWQRRRLSNATRTVLWVAMLACVSTGLIACGGGSSGTTTSKSPVTPVGASTVVVTLTAESGTSQSLNVSLTVTN